MLGANLSGVKAGAVLSAHTKPAAASTGVVVKPVPASAARNAPHATVISENSALKRDLTVHYYLPVGAVSPWSGIRTYPGNTVASITHGATRISSGIPAGSTFARLAVNANRPSTKARTVSIR